MFLKIVWQLRLLFCSESNIFIKNNQYFNCFISIVDKSDSNSSVPCSETIKFKTCFKMFRFNTPFLKPFVLQRVWALRIAGQSALCGSPAYYITNIRLRIGVAQTLCRHDTTFVRQNAEFTETSIAVNHSVNDFVGHWVDQSINVSVEHSAIHSVNHWGGHWINRSVSHSAIHTGSY